MGKISISALKVTALKPELVRPRYFKFLFERREQGYPKEIVETIKEILESDGRDRSGSFSASGAGYCQRRQLLSFLGAMGDEDFDSRTLTIFDDGNWRHLRVQAAGLTEGFLVDIEYPVTWRSKYQRGTLDGVGVVPDTFPTVEWRGLMYGFELKGVNPFSYTRQVAADIPMPKHLHQVGRYFALTDFELFVVLYENKATQEMHEWVIHRDDPKIEPYIKAEKAEIERLSESVNTKTLLPVLEPCAKQSKGKDSPYKDCPYGENGLCLGTKTWPTKNDPRYGQSNLGQTYRS